MMMKRNRPAEASTEPFPVTLEPEAGSLRFGGVPVWFMSPQHYVDRQVHLEEVVGKTSEEIQYRAAELAGIRAVRSIAGEPDPGAEEGARVSVLLKVLEVLPVLGHGTARLVLGNLRTLETTWTFPRSRIAELRHPASRPVCHFYVGAVAGFVSGAFGRSLRAEEVERRAKGDAACVIRTRAE